MEGKEFRLSPLIVGKKHVNGDSIQATTLGLRIFYFLIRGRVFQETCKGVFFFVLHNDVN